MILGSQGFRVEGLALLGDMLVSLQFLRSIVPGASARDLEVRLTCRRA